MVILSLCWLAMLIRRRFSVFHGIGMGTGCWPRPETHSSRCLISVTWKKFTLSRDTRRMSTVCKHKLNMSQEKKGIIVVSFYSLVAVAWHPVHESLFASGGGDGSILFWTIGWVLQQKSWVILMRIVGECVWGGINSHIKAFFKLHLL